MIYELWKLRYCPKNEGKVDEKLIRVCQRQAKSDFLKKVEKCQAESVFLFKNLRMSVFVISNAWKNFCYKKFKNFFKIKFMCESVISKYKFGY